MSSKLKPHLHSCESFQVNEDWSCVKILIFRKSRHLCDSSIICQTLIYVGKITKNQKSKYKYTHSTKEKNFMTMSMQSLETKGRIHAKILYIKLTTTIISNISELIPAGHGSQQEISMWE